MSQSLYRISTAAIGVLLRFLKLFVLTLGTAFSSEALQKLSNHIPLTIYCARKMLQFEDNFISFAVCPNCDSVYEVKDCIIAGNKSKLCHYVQFPNHPVRSCRKMCNTALLKKIKTKGKCRLVPIKVYPYYPLYASLKRLVQRKGFLKSCEHWRIRKPTTYLADIYDGLVWKEFEQSFLSFPYSYLLTLNIDWFQPFVHNTYSVGAIIYI